MSASSLFLCLVGLGLFSFFFGRRRIHRLATGASQKQHSRDVYHASFLVICATFVPIVLLVIWTGISPLVIDALLESFLKARANTASLGELSVMIAKTKAYYAGSISAAFIDDTIAEATNYYADLVAHSLQARSFAVLLLAIAGVGLGVRKIALRFTARSAERRVGKEGRSRWRVLQRIKVLLFL